MREVHDGSANGHRLWADAKADVFDERRAPGVATWADRLNEFNQVVDELDAAAGVSVGHLISEPIARAIRPVLPSVIDGIRERIALGGDRTLSVRDAIGVALAAAVEDDQPIKRSE